MFGISVLTSAGAQLLRNAIKNSDKIVFTRAIAGSAYDMDRGDLAAKPLDWYDGASGSIVSVSSALGNAQIFAGFDAVEEGTDPVKSVCICAQIAKDDVDPEYAEDDDVVFAACSDDNSGYISGTAFGVSFDLPVALSGIVDDVGAVPNNAGLSVVGFESGTLTVKLADGTALEISASEAS